MIMFHLFKLMNIRNRAYVVDNKGNKLFYGTEFQCRNFIKYMEGDENNGEAGRDPAGQRKDSVQLAAK